MTPPCPTARIRRAFTLVELLVASAVLGLLLVVLATVVGEVQRGWARTEARVSQFREARAAFEAITRNLSQAALNTYWDYDDPEDPQRYLRHSELHFVAGRADDLLPDAPPSAGAGRSTHATFFQAPLGFSTDEQFRQLGTMLNARGYFVEFGGDLDEVPAFVQSGTAGGYSERFRFRLMQFMPPAEENLVYAHDPDPATAAADNPPRDQWFDHADLVARYARPIANNVLALILSPQNATPEAGATGTAADPLAPAPEYAWDSSLDHNPGADTAGPTTRHLLPPLVRVTLVAIDERSAQRLEGQFGNDAAATTAALFGSSPFELAADYEADLAALEQSLLDLGLNYRVFSSTVTMRAAKWGG